MKIKVDHERMLLTADRMAQLTGEFEQECRQLFEIVNSTTLHWNGADQLVYVQQVNGFSDDLAALAQLLHQYSALTRECAISYANLQQQLRKRAAKLA